MQLFDQKYCHQHADLSSFANQQTLKLKRKEALLLSGCLIELNEGGNIMENAVNEIQTKRGFQEVVSSLKLLWCRPVFGRSGDHLSQEWDGYFVGLL